MNQDTLRYLTLLLDATRPQEGYLTLSALHPNQRGAYSRHIAVNPLDHTGLARALRDLETANHQGWGAFVGLALRKWNYGRYTRGGYDHILDNKVICIDIDQPPDVAIPALSVLPPPTCITDSGGGIHATWALRAGIDAAHANAITRHFSKLTGGDPAINATTSIRLPGSINTKANRGNIVTILELNANRYDPTELAPPPPIRSPPAVRCNSPINPELIAAVLTILYRDWDAAPRQSGSRWHAARCPFGHKRDRRGEHFYFDETSGSRQLLRSARRHLPHAAL